MTEWTFDSEADPPDPELRLEPMPGVNRYTELDLAPSDQAIEHARRASVKNTTRVRKHVGLTLVGRSNTDIAQFRRDLERIRHLVREYDYWYRRLSRSRAR